MDRPVLPLAKKGDLGRVLVRDQILLGHAYGFFSAESKEIYIYVAVQQHDVQMIQRGPARRPDGLWVLHLTLHNLLIQIHPMNLG